MSAILSEISRLKKSAMQGDKVAMRHLLEAGPHLNSAVYDVWFEPAYPLRVFAPDLPQRRQMFRKTLEQVRYLPTVTEVPDVWDLRPGRKKRDTSRSFELERQSRLLAEVTPRISGHGKQGMLRWVVCTAFIPRVEAARSRRIDDPQLVLLPPLSKATASRWATAFTDFVWQRQSQAIRTPGTEWNSLADGGRKNLKRKRKSKKQTTVRMVLKLKRSGEPGLADTRQKSRVHRMESNSATVADLKDGLYQNALRVFKSITPIED